MVAELTKPLRCKKQNLYVKGGGGEKWQFLTIFQIFNFFIAQKVKANDLGLTIYWLGTQTTQVMYSDKSFKIMKKIFLFLNLFIVYWKQVKFWNGCNKKGSPRILTQVYFLVIERIKKEGSDCLLFSFLKIELSFPWNTLKGTVSCLVEINLKTNSFNFKYEKTQLS